MGLHAASGGPGCRCYCGRFPLFSIALDRLCYALDPTYTLIYNILLIYMFKSARGLS